MTTLPIPESIIARQTAKILATERDIFYKRNPLNASFIHNHEESLVARFRFLRFAADERPDMTLEDSIQSSLKYLHLATSLDVIDRLQIFWKYV